MRRTKCCQQPLIVKMIKKAKALGKHVGICEQAPSGSDDLAALLIDQGIDSIAFNPDALLKGIRVINRVKDNKQIVAVN
ncbi:putative PEP-binding protein [Pedobacter sp. Du54]